MVIDSITADPQAISRWSGFRSSSFNHGMRFTGALSGVSRLPTREISDWAAANGSVIFTHDLDFGALLALRSAPARSVIQLRGQRTTPAQVGKVVVAALAQLKGDLERGALVTMGATRIGARVLPLR